ncbi:protease inhibitor I42 family protein [Streptomyces sp. NPDC002343]
MTLRTSPLAPAALLLLLAVTGCGGNGTTTGAPGPTTAGGTEYGFGRRDVTAAPGDRFSLTVPSAPALGEHWYLAGPRPDKAVPTYRGEHATGDGSRADGSTGSTRSFGFTARARGRTTVRLLHCPPYTCPGPGPGASRSPSPYPTLTADPHSHAAGAGFYVFTVTVR